MRFTLLVIFCAASLTASAQFWHRKPPRPALLTEAQFHNQPIKIKIISGMPQLNVPDVQPTHSVYGLELAEDLILKEAKHNMRFRIYSVASYNFSDLAALYLQQNRFSEAKWYLLQSNNIARQTENTRHIIDNLLALADIKSKLGETALAMIDLQEAHDMAIAKGMQTDTALIEGKIKYLQTNKIATAKIELRYAEAVETANKSKIN